MPVHKMPPECHRSPSCILLTGETETEVENRREKVGDGEEDENRMKNGEENRMIEKVEREKEQGKFGHDLISRSCV